MTVRCLSNIFTKEQKWSRGAFGDGGFAYSLLPDKEYLVLAITVLNQSPSFGVGAVYQVIDEYDRLMSVPSCLFTITDPRCSSKWQCRISRDGSFLIWPRQFFIPFFHDQLSDGDPSLIITLIETFSELEQESRDQRTVADDESPSDARLS